MSHSAAAFHQTIRSKHPILKAPDNLLWHPKTGMEVGIEVPTKNPVRGTYSRFNGVWRIFTRHTNGKKIGWQHIPQHHIPKKLRVEALVLGIRV